MEKNRMAGRSKQLKTLIVGENDDSTPVSTIKILYDALPGPKELHVIKGALHTFRDLSHLKEIREIFLKWIDRCVTPRIETPG
ncbi:MAG: hypothetical protein HY052_05670 [Proteobacteria bacterium]|nr:hypothetical protein [Pseudomonadota bacterium]